jgi:hypothetical protein
MAEEEASKWSRRQEVGDLFFDGSTKYSHRERPIINCPVRFGSSFEGGKSKATCSCDRD